MPSGLIVSLEPQDRAYNRSGQSVEAKPDGSFQLAVRPGDYDVAAEHDDLYVSDIRVGDQDALSGIHVGAQPLGPLTIILKGNGGTVLANVKDTDGKPRPNCYAQLMPDPPRRKQRIFYSYCRTDATGKCAMPGIAPGAYRIFTGLDLRHPDELADIEDSGTAFTIGEGEKRQLEINPIAEDKPI